MQGFRDFLMRGNLIDLAIAFVLGASFNSVVQSFTKLVMDVLGLFGGNPDFSTVHIGPINVGVFLTACVSFVMMSAILYFGIVRPYEAIKKANAKTKPEQPSPATTEELLTEIRDLLAKTG